MIYNYIIIGGGIVGIATAWQLIQRFPQKKILLIEKENTFAAHQTGHNSGVVHAGVYYEPNSLKSKFCKAGASKTIEFCEENSIPFKKCGKLLVATNDQEIDRMHALFDRCEKNKIEAEILNRAQVSEREPNILGVGGIFVKNTAIVDYQKISTVMAQKFEQAGGKIQLNNNVVELCESKDDIKVKTKCNGVKSVFTTKFLISCSGLMADRVAKMLGIAVDFQIIPYRGEYYKLAAKYNNIINHLIYPIPNPDLPFLGIHLTRMIDGSVTVGPNAVQGWKREGYGKININLRDVSDMLLFSGFWKVLRSHFVTGLTETINSIYKPGYLNQVKKYCPQLQLSDLEPYPAGIRAQAVRNDGSLVHDFLFANSPRSLHVCNAPSPAATSAMPIAEYICDKISNIQ